jgi:hypothetical protein
MDSDRFSIDRYPGCCPRDLSLFSDPAFARCRCTVMKELNPAFHPYRNRNSS